MVSEVGVAEEGVAGWGAATTMAEVVHPITSFAVWSNLHFLFTTSISIVIVCKHNRFSTSLGNSGLCWTIFARNRDTVVPAEGNGDLQTPICVLVARPRRCPTLSNPVPQQNWMAAYLGYTLQMKTLFHADQLWLRTRIREEEEACKLGIGAVSSSISA